MTMLSSDPFLALAAWKRGSGGGLNGMEDGRGDRYGYDPEGQLTAASYRALNPETQTPSGALRSDSFQYDALGNRFGTNRVASRGLLDFTRRDNGLNQYLMWSPFSALYYDDSRGTPPAPYPTAPWVPPGNGVTMADGWITASYNALNQPVAMGSTGLGSNFIWYWHDPLGRCVKRWLGNVNQVPTGPITYFYYDGWNLVQEGPNASTADRLYVHGGRVDEIVASQVGGQWYNHHYDARGHCILLTTASGALEQQYDYDAFGFPYFYTATGAKLNTSLVKTRFLFTGREWLNDLRVYDYRKRVYQPELGRFLQPDPIQFAAGDYNLYRYCHNDPINKSDPFGLAVEDWRVDWSDHGGPHIQNKITDDRWDAGSLRPLPHGDKKMPDPLNRKQLDEIRRSGAIDQISNRLPDSPVAQAARNSGLSKSRSLPKTKARGLIRALGQLGRAVGVGVTVSAAVNSGSAAAAADVVIDEVAPSPFSDSTRLERQADPRYDPRTLIDLIFGR